MADMLSGPPGAAGNPLLGYQEREGACLHCSWLEQELEQAKYECTRLSNQVLELVQQKLSLSQQVDAWEVSRTYTLWYASGTSATVYPVTMLHSLVHLQMDVAAMVEGNITKQLQHDRRKSIQKRQPQTTPCNSSQKSWTSMLRSAFS